MLMMGSMLAGIAFGNSDVGAVHCLAESIGSLFDIPHGVANSVFLPYVMEFNLPVSIQKYSEIARLSGIQDRDNRSASLKFIQMIKNISRDLNIPSFRDLGIGENHFAEIAQKSFKNNSNPSNPRSVAEKDYVNILKKALDEK
jgi:alcohol dehydrogenase